MESKKINQLATNVAPVASDLTIVGDPTTGVSKKVTLSQIASLFAGAVDFYTNLAAFPATGVLNTIYCAKDTQKLYLWSGSAYVETFPSQAVLNTYQLLSEKGVSNGYAGLDAAGKVPIAQLPSSIMEYKGLWSAATNTPTLANGTGDTGDVYICSAAGSVNFGAGAITFAVGDYVIYSGSIWQRSSGAVGTVTSVGLSSATSGVTIGSSPITTSGTITLAIATATTSQNGLLSSTDWATFNAKQNTITLTTTGTSGASTLVGATLNIPNYGSALTGYVPYTGATGTVNLGAYDLTVNNLTIGKGTSALSNNSALGYRALFHITTGNYNTAVGYESAHNTTTGQYNTALGQSALFTNTTGSQNTALGLNALLNNTTGGSNVVVGLDALQHNTTGSSNTALGYNAGSHITGGATPNTTASNSIYIGRDTRANVDGGTNEIVIGNTVTGNGSNTVTIGNSSITANYFKGSINADSFVKSGGTSSQFLKADGTVDSNTYALDSAVVHLAGTETITGAKTFSGYTTFTSTVDITSGLTFSNSGFTLLLQPPTLSVNRTVTLPNGTGTLALTSDISYPVTSVFGRTGAVVATSGDYTTAQVTESGNLYFTDSRARLALSFVAGSGAYNSTTGVITIPTNNNQITNGAGYTTNVGTVTSVAATGGTGISITGSPITTSGTITITNTAPDQTVALTASTGISVSGTYPNFTITNTSPSSGGTVTSVAALTIGTSGTDLSSTVATGTTTPVITLNVPTASATNRGALSSADWTTFNNKQGTITLTTTGTSGAATFSANTLNIPDYGSALSGYVTLTTNQTISGVKTFSSMPILSAASGVNGQIVYADATNTLKTITNFKYDDATGVLTTQLGNLGSNAYTSTAYLPLTGGTLTGALGGTSASFSSSVTANQIFSTTTAAGYAAILTNTNGASDSNGLLVKASSMGTEYVVRFANQTDTSTFFTIKGTGNVLIGTTTDSGYKLDVNGTGRFSSSVDATVANLSSGLKVTGSGLTSGTGAEIVYSSGKGLFLTFNRATSTYLPTEIDGSTVTLSISGTPKLTIASTGAATFSSSVDARGDVTIGARTADTDSTLTFANSSDSQVRIIAQDFATDGRLGFWLNQSGFGFVERMVIKRDTGNVGIGTSSPVRTLHLNSASDTRLLITDDTIGTTTNDGTYYRQSGVNAYIVNQ